MQVQLSGGNGHRVIAPEAAWEMNVYGIVFRVLGAAIVILIALYSSANAFRKARQLDARIREFKREQEEAKTRGKPLDPYRDLAEIYAERDSKKGKR